MKKFNLITFAVILMLLPILQSCLDDANNDEWVTCPPGGILAIGTMKIPNADTPRDFFIALTMETMYFRQIRPIYATGNTLLQKVKESSLAICRWEKRNPDMRTVKYSR